MSIALKKYPNANYINLFSIPAAMEEKEILITVCPDGFPVGIRIRDPIPRLTTAAYDFYRTLKVHASQLVYGKQKEPIKECAPEAAASSLLEKTVCNGFCLVCRDALVGKLTQCSLCETPYHTGCWEYMEGCSTYACLNAVK